jgi:hypothetical protein
MQYPFWYILAHWCGDWYDLTPLYIGGYRIMVYTVVVRITESLSVLCHTHSSLFYFSYCFVETPTHVHEKRN